MKAFWCGLVAVSMIISVGVFILTRPATVPVSTVDSDTAVKPPSNAGLNWVSGDRQAYSLDMQSDITLGHTPPSSGSIKHKLTGTLHMRVFDVADEGIKVGFQLSHTLLDVSGSADPSLNEALSSLFYVIFSKQGLALRQTFPGNTDKPIQEMLWELVRSFQVAVQNSSDGKWDVEEEHGSGIYSARYEIQTDGTLQKRKLKYLFFKQRGASGMKQGKIDIKRSLATITLNKDGSWIDQMRFEEELAVTSDSKTILRAHTTSKLVQLSTWTAENLAIDKISTDSALARITATENGDTATVSPVTEIQDPVSPEELSEASDTLDELMDAFIFGTEDRQYLRHQLRELIQQYPELSDRIPALIAQHHLTDHTAADLIHLLEQAGHDEAQTALVTLMNESTADHLNRIRATVALGGLDEPSLAALNGLWQRFGDRSDPIAKDLSNTAILSIGSIAARQRIPDPDSYGTLSDQLENSLAYANDAETRAVVLKAIANTGGPELSPTVQSYLSDPQPRVRAAAATSLGRMAPDGVARSLADKLTDESNRRVRTAIGTGLLESKQADTYALSVINELIPTETNESSRYAMVQYLGMHLAEYPEGRTTLENALKIEPSKRISQRISELLSTTPGR
ncbi:MAG: hypothetical protein HKM93_06635 [Desulfobacteraceae bacterium]|nr:hypothetical protein [Desulfobacteraceae bacterium]